MKVTVWGNDMPRREEIKGQYDKGNPVSTIPVSYTTGTLLIDGWASKIELARHRHRDTVPQLESTVMSVEIDELDGLIQLLTETRDLLKERGLNTEYKWP